MAESDYRKGQVYRLNSNEPQKVADALLGLYQIDTSAFKKQDQYGLDLLMLALLQPEAFWVARIGNKYVGYFSLFIFRGARLYKNLVNEAKKGTLDLPYLIYDYSKEMIRSEEETGLTDIHLYIDAIAVVSRQAGITAQTRQSIRKDLINTAMKDLALINKATICTIAIRPGISSLVEKLGTPLEHVGGRKEAVTGDSKYRELFACHKLDNKRFEIIMKSLSSITSNLRFGLRLGYDQLRGSPTLDLFTEPRG